MIPARAFFENSRDALAVAPIGQGKFEEPGAQHTGVTRAMAPVK